MPFRKIEQEKIANAIVRQIENLILKGVLKQGERLPSERDLALKFEVSRPSVREAIADLEARDLVETRPGAGVYIAQVLGSAFSPALVEMFSSHKEARYDYLTFRRDLEGMAAERAAVNASDTDLEVIRHIFQRMEAAHTKRNPQLESMIDAEFHMAVVDAAHNVIMLHMMRSMFEMLHAGVFYNRSLLFENKSVRTRLLEQHRDLFEALIARDPVRARQAVDDHLGFIELAMLQQEKDEGHEETARQRFEHEKAR